jgi:hypothetical protein
MLGWFLACVAVVAGCWSLWGWAGVAIAVGGCVMVTILLAATLRE